MRVLHVRNVNDALPNALRLLEQIGERRESRNGPVLCGGSVTTVYSKPVERVLFNADRDANPFFHLYESLWMLCGRNDVAPLCRYVKRSAEYSDNGIELHGAYGYRWRNHFNVDQLEIIATRLREDPDDRRSVLQMWNSSNDLFTNDEAKLVRPKIGKDFPCNTTATFQRGVHGELNLTVFCRSNDVVWGAYGANAVQFSMLLEYMARWIGCPVGAYTQISVNWHGYLNTLEQVKNVRPDHMGWVDDPYKAGWVHPLYMEKDGNFEDLNFYIEKIVADADNGFTTGAKPDIKFYPWAFHVWLVLRSHHIYKLSKSADEAIASLTEGDETVDWVAAARQWFERRKLKAERTDKA